MQDKAQGISRRKFLTGAAVTGAAAAVAGLAGCAPAATTPATNAPAGGGTAGTPVAAGAGEPWWLTAPEPIADSEITETLDTEVLILGAGNSGCSAACSAAENGAKVLVVDKTATVNGRGGGVGACNSRENIRVGATIKDTVAAGYRWNRTCGNRNDERLVKLWMDQSGNAMNWLLDKADKRNVTYQIFAGYSYSKIAPEEPTNHTFRGPEGWSEGVPEEARSCGYIPTQLTYMDSLEAGASYLFEHTGLQLVKEGDKVVGAIVEDANGAKKKINASKAVILATGDIHGSEEMMDYYCEKIMKNVIRSDYTPVGINTGDGHKMGMWAGGVMQDSPLPIALHPQAGAWFHGPFMFVNFEGRRFFNEGTWVQAKSLQCMKQTNHYAFSIFDANFGEDTKKSLSDGGGMFWDSMSRGTTQEFTPDMVTGLVEMQSADEQVAWKADTLEELADKIGVDKAAFLDEVERYNGFCEKGVDDDYAKESVFLFPIKEPPFYATMCAPAILVCVGGLNINTDLQVLDANRKPIGGLYAIGNTSGGLHAVDYAINCSSNSNGRCFTWGWLVGKTVAAL